MFNMLNQLWAMLGMFFAGGEKLAAGFNNLGSWVDESSAAFVDEARIKRYSARQAMLAELGITDTEFKALTTNEVASAVKPKMKSIKASVVTAP